MGESFNLLSQPNVDMMMMLIAKLLRGFGLVECVFQEPSTLFVHKNRRLRTTNAAHR